MLTTLCCVPSRGAATGPIARRRDRSHRTAPRPVQMLRVRVKVLSDESLSSLSLSLSLSLSNLYIRSHTITNGPPPPPPGTTGTHRWTTQIYVDLRRYGSIPKTNETCGQSRLQPNGMLIEMATLLKKTKNTLNKMSMSMHFLLPLAEHSWLQNAEKAANVPLGDVVKSRLKQFSTMNRFKRRALRVIADHLSTEEVEGIKEVFKMIDMDNDGIVSCEELKSGLAKFGTQLVDMAMSKTI